MKISIKNIKPKIGGIVTVDKANLCDPDVVKAINAAVEERGVLVFPQMNLTDAEQLAFTDALGARVNYTKKAPGSDVPAKDIYKITLNKDINKEPDYVLGTFWWHIDGATMDVPLPKSTLLTAKALAATGGSTEFSNLFAAYEMLPEEEKQALEGLKVIHHTEANVRPVYGVTPQDRIDRYREMGAPMERPLVWTHEDGRKSLLLGTHADGIIGMPGPHGRATLCRLEQWAAQPDFCYTHHWTVGDLAYWNNHGTMHRVIPYTDEVRSMHRTTIAGTDAPGHAASADDVAKILEPVM
jgi:alpha-ketoglutarate-dependent taurine dioxygenase